MAIRVALNHRTEYQFDRPVSLSPHIIRLWPAPHCRTPILSRSLKVTPKDHFINWQQDPYSNHLARLVFPNKARELIIDVDIVAEMTVINPFDFFIEPHATHYPFSYDPALARELTPFLETLALGPRLAKWMEGVPRAKTATVDFIVALNQRLQKELKYIIRLEPGVQTCEETLERSSGSCRDSAWLLVQILRRLGLAARFVSGYLIQLTPDVKALDGPAGPSEDFVDLHAWTEVYLPGAGWVGFDPTSGLAAGEGHIPLACTADPASAGPVSGAVDECEVKFSFSMSRQRIHEDPRVTKPYSEEQWKEIQQLGRQVDARLKQDDVRLTMGGEPTFVAVDYPDDAEWNTSAVGPRKRKYAAKLIHRLKERFAPGALMHFGQGKWYPGESLPRWALGCYWRKDGEPIWEDPALIADEERNPGYSEREAKKFVDMLTQRLELAQGKSGLAIPGYEDVWHYMLQERRLPANVDPLKSNLKDAEERRRLAKIFEQGLSKIVGYALPLQRRNVGGTLRWVSGPWFLRREHLYLLPGDSPMGYRLPLDSLPWMAEGDFDYQHELDPLETLAPLPRRSVPQRFILSEKDAVSSREGRLQHQSAGEEKVPPGVSSGVIRTALCVEPRDGQLHVFMPPQRLLEDYLNLVAAVEETAKTLNIPVFVEGYAPPHDSRLQSIKVTPDPGVIEVNIHPARDWEELSQNTQIIYEEARKTRLATEKFMLDGRHTGTGGGNHIIIGGETPADSPLLRRPDLLRSMLGYWQNHPSLSYLFSGMFIGPTSQHPRLDEARNDSLYEMEIAFRQIPDPAVGKIPPWLVDRVLRNLLTDATGNTHRAEFSIDKLYSPDSSSGRLGLLELRSFEMPPHYQMSLAQQVLLRALIAHFWRAPYKQKLVPWGTEIHDRFMLPHFVREDFRDVIGNLREGGFGLDERWFEPHLEFRFPPIGSFTQRGVHIELRQALEPWHVLGEETAPAGTVRYVDSSVERLQVKVAGLTGTRHVVACNGRAVPLHPTGTNGEFVAGVRYRAWQPPSCLHPTIGVHAPLVFDLIDGWNGRSLGGCMYHVMHPGGRSYTTFPVNANEAEARRMARFHATGHTPGKVQAPPAERTADFPFTLDLRG